MKFKRLGLVIIDEEHRFGVRQKEALKKLRAEVDVLTLTATPIPRTLAMSLEGIRDFSVIATAPEKRLAIKTFVSPCSEGLIREAVMRELKRGGQVYFLHNEVDSIERMRERLERLLPEARIAVAHGQMRERELERVMRDSPRSARRAPVLDHHRDRHRQPARQHHRHQPRRPQFRASGAAAQLAAASAARTTRPTPISSSPRPRTLNRTPLPAPRGDPNFDGESARASTSRCHDLGDPRRGRGWLSRQWAKWK